MTDTEKQQIARYIADVVEAERLMAYAMNGSTATLKRMYTHAILLRDDALSNLASMGIQPQIGRK